MTAATQTTTTQTTTQTAVNAIDRVDFYAYFTATDTFEKLVSVIPHPKVKELIEQWGIGDDLTRSDFGKWIYDYESGGLLEKPVREALEVLEALDEDEWDRNYEAVCEIAEAYAAFANDLQASE